MKKMKEEEKYRIIVAMSIMAICLVVTPTSASDNFDAVAGSDPDLIVTDILLNCGYLFGNESNEICATVENTGFADAGAFNVGFIIDGFSAEVRVDGGLTAGASTTVCVTDPTLRIAGDFVTIMVIADCKREVAELDETNNWMTTSETVVNNGYKGKRYTGGDDITTWGIFELKGNLLYSLGDSYYLSASTYPDWTDYTVNWTASDLSVPYTATVEEARLYVPYTWDKADVMPDKVSLTFNGIAQTLDAHHSDRKDHGSYDYPYGMLVYDVTDVFDTSGNIAALVNSHPGGVSMRGMLLVVVYADESEPMRKIIVNEGFDMLYGGSSKCTTPEEATAYAPFGAIDTSDIETATLITVVPGADGPEGDLLFNGQTWTDVWSYSTDAQIGIDERDVTQYLHLTENEAGFQSSADYMEASNAILIVEYGPEPTVAISTDKLKYWAGETMTVTINITSPSPHTFEWFIGIPQFDIWAKVANVPIPAGFDSSYTIPIPVGDWGTTSFGIVHYVHLLDPDDIVVVTDVACCDYQTHPLTLEKAMPVDIEKEIRKTIGKVELGR